MRHVFFTRCLAVDTRECDNGCDIGPGEIFFKDKAQVPYCGACADYAREHE